MSYPFRKHLSAPGMLKAIRMKFEDIPDPRIQKMSTISLADSLMSGLAIFGLKYPSLLQFDKDRNDGTIKNNLRSLYEIRDAPCDTQMREINDEVHPNSIRPAFTSVFSILQRSKALESYRYIDGYHLISVDGTGHLSSRKVNCDNCLIKTSKSGKTTYYHQALGAVMVHPEIKQVIPIDVEPITKQDGSSKNDCERNAAKRLLGNLRKTHPNLKAIIVEDSLAANGPHIKLLKLLDMHYIVGVKPGDHKHLFDYVERSEQEGKVENFEIDKDGVTHIFRFINNVPLNKEHSDLLVNFIEYWEERDTTTLHFSWITSISLSTSNVYTIMKGGRSRWKIENETFNTLKNQGYHFEHNFGHGEKNLASAFLLLMMLAFFVDQAQQLGCWVFQKARRLRSSNRDFWEKMRAIFVFFCLDGWQTMFDIMITGPPHKRSEANLSQGP